MNIIAGILFLLAATYEVFAKEEINLEIAGRSIDVKRAEKPVLFWVLIAVEFAVGCRLMLWG